MKNSICLLVFLAVSASGAPQLNFIYPAGGAPGKELTVEVGGPDIDVCSMGVFSGEGVRAIFLGPAKQAVAVSKNKTKSVAVPNRLLFKVVIAEDAEPGIRSFRIGTTYRLTEPVHFEVSPMPELTEAVTNRRAAVALTVPALPVCINGRAQDEPDTFRFTAAKGADIVAFPVSEVRPYGVPAPRFFFLDSAGKALEARVCPRSAAYVLRVPADGEYSLAVSAPTNSSGNVYRVKLGSLPLITKFTPDRAPKGESLNVSLEGVNLPQDRVRLFTGGKDDALCLKTLAGDALLLPGLRFTLKTEDDELAPDFIVRVAPASVNIPSLGSALVRLYVERLNGFKGDVQVKLDYPPLSICCEGGRIPAGETEGRMTVSTDGARYPRVVFDLEMAATAEIGGQPVKRPVIPVRIAADGTPAAAERFGDIAAKCNSGLTSYRLAIPAANLRISLKNGLRVPNAPSPLSVNWGETYEPYVLWPSRGVSVSAAATPAAVRVTLDPALYKAGTQGTLVIGVRVRKTGIPVANSQCIFFTAAE
jgi:hypothetical protein